MDNQNNHINKGIVIAVLCLIIGVVLGSVLMTNKTPAGSLKGQAIDSKYAEIAMDDSPDRKVSGIISGLISSGQISSIGVDRKKIESSYNGQGGSNRTYIFNCPGEPGFIATGSFSAGMDLIDLGCHFVWSF